MDRAETLATDRHRPKSSDESVESADRPILERQHILCRHRRTIVGHFTRVRVILSLEIWKRDFSSHVAFFQIEFGNLEATWIPPVCRSQHSINTALTRFPQFLQPHARNNKWRSIAPWAARSGVDEPMKRPTKARSCPDHIIKYAERATSFPGQKAVVSAVEEVKSAQQFVYVLSISSVPAPHDDMSVCDSTDDNNPYQKALADGRNKLVVRIWKASARWWNLNTNDAAGENGGAVRMARSEVAGYRMARAAIACSSKSADMLSSGVIIPQVLYFSHDYRKHSNGSNTIHGNKIHQHPWAILTYVGDGSSFFCDDNYAGNEDTCWACDCRYAKGMVKIRHEYGFDEPHPRHGRVKEDRALEYSLEVMDSVVLPIQSAFFSSSDEGISNHRDKHWLEDLCVRGKKSDADTCNDSKPYRYQDMVEIYRNAAAQMTTALLKKESGTVDSTLSNLLNELRQCIEALSVEAKQCSWLGPKSLPPTLCHMDLQPQNMIFRRRKGEVYTVDVVPRVSSVLDWEEACYADPRFEVLLMGRKVCASREQADKLWSHYSQYLKEKHRLEVGPIEPWLKLETIHSITTLLMQCMDLVGGGRNPWESKPDLLGKIEREFRRLQMLGWDFC